MVGFYGLESDVVAGLIEARNRMLHPALGAWLQRDPAGYIGGHSLYECERSRPTVFVDPMGMFVGPLPVADGVAEGVGVAEGGAGVGAGAGVAAVAVPAGIVVGGAFDIWGLWDFWHVYGDINQTSKECYDEFKKPLPRPVPRNNPDSDCRFQFALPWPMPAGMGCQVCVYKCVGAITLVPSRPIPDNVPCPDHVQWIDKGMPGGQGWIPPQPQIPEGPC